MKKLLFPFLLFSVVLSANSQTLDLQNRILVNRHKMQQDGLIRYNEKGDDTKTLSTRSENLSSNIDDSERNIIQAFVKIKEGFGAENLERLGMTVNTIKGRIAIVSMPLDSLESFSGKECVEKITIEKKLSTHLDKAREVSGVDDILSGKNLKVPYTGKDVLGIIVDQGIDPNHVAFLDENGANRVKYLTYLDGTLAGTGYPKVQYYGEDIVYEDNKGNLLHYPSVSKFNTDLYNAYHATHTLNILGGSYLGNITVSDNGTLKEIPNCYYGVAPETDLAVSCGDLSDTSVAWGIAEMLSYAEYRKESDGMPSVMSLSLGSTAGPHDPGNLMNEFLELCGEDAIIVISAGNEGDLKLALNKRFSSEDNVLQSMVYPYGIRYEASEGAASSSNTYVRNGVVMIYSNDATPFTIKGFIMTGTPGNYRKRATLDISSAEGKYYVSDSYYTDYVGGVLNATVQKYFKGYVGGGAMLDESLGRYYGAFDYYLETDPVNGINADGSEAVIIGFEITGEEGQRIDCYCDGINTWISNYGMDGYQDGSRDGTISDMAVGKNVLVVGAYNTRDSWYALDGKKYTYDNTDGFELGEVGPYSSYGTLIDGRTLPHVCAPGTAVMSAVSTPWIENYFKGYEKYIPSNTTARATYNGRNYYWKPETGTSMSTPFVAGSIALWLEADPTLTINDIYDIIDKTSKKDSQVAAGNSVQWGAGKFDALAGLKEVINRREVGVGQISADNRNDRLILSETSPGVFELFVGGSRQLNVDIYSMGGSHVFAKNIPGNEGSIDLKSLSKGIYLLKVNNHVEKIYVK